MLADRVVIGFRDRCRFVDDNDRQCVFVGDFFQLVVGRFDIHLRFVKINARRRNKNGGGMFQQDLRLLLNRFNRRRIS